MKIVDCIKKVFIVAYKEDTSLLEAALKKEGFLSISVIRPSYTQTELEYSRTSRCLLNHKNAWMECCKNDGLFMILEADFVPVIGIGQLPLMFDFNKKESSWGWLYTGGARLYELDKNNYGRGHSACPVATIMGQNTARVLIDFVNNEFEKHNPREYTLWDTYIRMYAQKYGIMSFIAYRNYGEHGGIPNPEHAAEYINPIHRAEVLWGPLHFLPLYAKGSAIKFILCRIVAKMRGVARLLVGRYIELALLKNSDISSKKKIIMIFYGVKRLISLY
jgi:hypothetical protein